MEEIRKTLNAMKGAISEYESKKILASYDIPITREKKVDNAKGLRWALEEIGFPVVLKGCSSELAHKTEQGLVKLDIKNEVLSNTIW